MAAVVAALGMASPAMVGRGPNDTVPFGGTTAMGIHAWTAMPDRIRKRMAFFILTFLVIKSFIINHE
jgi:hypothetical protein